MKFVLLGDNRAVLPLVRAMAAHADHALVRAALAAGLQGELMRVAPGVRITADWDELLAGDEFDAAIVAGHSADALLAARQLAQSGTALVVLPDVRQGAEFVYELTLIRDDTQAALVPLFPRRFERGVRELAESIRSGAGRVLHVEMEREEPAAAASGAVGLLTTAEIEAALLEDADLLRSVGGDYNQVTALHSGRTESGVAAASVSLAGENLPEASWSLKAGPRSAWRIAATTERGTVSSASDGDGSETRPPAAESAADDVGTRMLGHVEQALSGGGVRPDWTDLARAFEVVEAAQRSVARRRTIDLHFETTSERSQFKTKMTALGCGLLSATLFGVVVVLLLGTLFQGGRDERELQRLLGEGWTIERIAADPERLPGHDAAELRRMLERAEFGDAVMRIARVVVFLPLAVFLVLQLLVFVARPASRGQG